MPTISLSEETLALLGSLAIPFVDLSPESVIVRLAKDALERRDGSDVPVAGGVQEVNALDPDHPVSLTHSKVLFASIDGEPMYKANWNAVLDRLHTIARERLGSFAALRAESGANLKEGRFTNDGYRYLPEIDLSIQGVESNLAWSHSLNLARRLNIPIEVKLMWREKTGAARPGETAVLKWRPKA